jgi:serine/threonine protein kinase
LIDSELSHFRVKSKIGAGGMGEVYRATDTKLGREVALKVLPEGLSRDADRMARFKREAQLLASLNHPNIAAIYGLEDADGVRALIMELVEGPTLAERIARGQMPPEEALPIARQIAEALEYAHERGIVHRDLKPANIKITPEGATKVLDFGLAKAMTSDEPGLDPSNSPTMTMAMTQAGFIVGTAAYMAPEQAKGRPTDRRADIWAFGCVLYEMLSGRQAFPGETVSDILASVLRSDPDWSGLPADTPASIQRLLRRCLIKEPKQRLRDMGEARIAIEETLSGASADGAPAISDGSLGEPSSLLRRALPWALGASTLLFAAISAWLVFQPKPPQPVFRYSILPPENQIFRYGGEMSISPDGRYLAFVTQSGPGKQFLWVQPLDSLTAMPIPVSGGANAPFWSPDSKEIGFNAGGKLEKFAVAGGQAQTLCDHCNVSAADWNRDGVILFMNVGNGGLYRVPDTGGAPTLVVAPNPAHHDTSYRSPQFLPDGRHFLFQAATSDNSAKFIAVGSLDSKSVTYLAQGSSQASYAAPGYLLYMEQSALMARPFDSKALRFTGTAVPIAQNIGQSGGGFGFFSVSPAGVLTYATGSLTTTGTGTATSQMTWYSRDGKKLDTVGQPDIYTDPALSQDGSRVAVAIGEQGARNIWVLDTRRGTASRLTFSSEDDVDPAWKGDGSQILFGSHREGEYDIYQKAANGLGNEQLLFQSKSEGKRPDDVSPDGRYAIYDAQISAASDELWALPLLGERKPFSLVQGIFFANSARFSPSGRYVAYTSYETGSPEVYVETFPQPTGKWQISATRGWEPMWRHDGKELYYLTPDNQLMAVAVDSDSAAFQAGIPKQLFQAQVIPSRGLRNVYVASPDGQRFLMLTATGAPKPLPITVVVNWAGLLKKQSGGD